jgi:hypothetical protein
MNNVMIAKRISFLILFGGLVFVTNLNAQSFVTPLTSITGDSRLTTVDGKEIPCNIRMAMFGPTGIASLTIKDSITGEKNRFKAEQVTKTITRKCADESDTRLNYQQI